MTQIEANLNLVIREAKVSDCSELGELLVRSFVQTYAEKMPEVVVSEARKKELRDVASRLSCAKVFVAVVLDGVGIPAKKIVGTICLMPAGHPEAESWKENFAGLRMMAVDPDHHGEGIAEKLLAESVRVAQTQRSTGICLHVRRGAHGVARFYQKHGFVRDEKGDLNLLPEIYLEGYALGF